MDNQVQVFESESFGRIRTVVKDGEPWFVAADVCRALEIDRSQSRRLDEDEKAAVCLTHTSSNGTEQGRDVTIINEPGLYSLVLDSRKPEAKDFKRWVTHDILPSIRRHGLYAMNELLYVLGVQYKRGQTWVLKQEYARAGYTKSYTYLAPSGESVVQTRWTQKGWLFIYELLKKERGILPLDGRAA